MSKKIDSDIIKEIVDKMTSVTTPGIVSEVLEIFLSIQDSKKEKGDKNE